MFKMTSGDPSNAGKRVASNFARTRNQRYTNDSVKILIGLNYIVHYAVT